MEYHANSISSKYNLPKHNRTYLTALFLLSSKDSYDVIKFKCSSQLSFSQISFHRYHRIYLAYFVDVKGYFKLSKNGVVVILCINSDNLFTISTQTHEIQSKLPFLRNMAVTYILIYSPYNRNTRSFLVNFTVTDLPNENILTRILDRKIKIFL